MFTYAYNTKNRTKVRLFFYMTKYFGQKMLKFLKIISFSYIFDIFVVIHMSKCKYSRLRTTLVQFVATDGHPFVQSFASSLPIPGHNRGTASTWPYSTHCSPDSVQRSPTDRVTAPTHDAAPHPIAACPSACPTRTHPSR